MNEKQWNWLNGYRRMQLDIAERLSRQEEEAWTAGMDNARIACRDAHDSTIHDIRLIDWIIKHLKELEEGNENAIKRGNQGNHNCMV